jgi:hypothetical protein
MVAFNFRQMQFTKKWQRVDIKLEITAWKNELKKKAPVFANQGLRIRYM